MLRDLWLVLTGGLSSDELNKLAQDILRKNNELKAEREYSRERLEILLQGVGRIVAKDTAFMGDPLDPVRRAESDKLAEEAIRRLKAEDWARRHTAGEA